MIEIAALLLEIGNTFAERVCPIRDLNPENLLDFGLVQH
jgi:hypothetical protein